jgi:hypothetical protein
MSECVEHFIEGKHAWKIGVLGFFTRLRGLVLTSVLTLLTMGTPFWWPQQFPDKVEIHFVKIFLCLASGLGLSLVAGFYYLRKRSQRSLDTKAYLHEMSHFIRDNQTKVYKLVNKKIERNTEDEDSERFQNFIEGICNKIKYYYVNITNDTTVECSIRLAVDISTVEGKSDIRYVTVGRSSGLNKRREDSSEAIKSNEGLARFMIEQKEQGVLVYNDLQKAIGLNLFKETENERRFPDEIKTMMVAPLNSWDGKRQSMIGLLYVSSRNKNVFNVRNIDSMRFLSDFVAQSIADTVNVLKVCKRMPSLIKGVI